MQTTTHGITSHTDFDYAETEGSIFGGTVLATVGLFQFFEGLSAVLKDDVFVSTPSYSYAFDLTGWGWTHLIIGVIAFAVGIAVIMGQVWGMLTGIVLATVSALMQFLFLPWQPVWALVILALNIAVIWAIGQRLRNT